MDFTERLLRSVRQRLRRDYKTACKSNLCSVVRVDSFPAASLLHTGLARRIPTKLSSETVADI